MDRAQALFFAIAATSAGVALMVLEYRRTRTEDRPRDAKATAVWVLYVLVVALGLSVFMVAVAHGRALARMPPPGGAACASLPAEPVRHFRIYRYRSERRLHDNAWY